MRNGLPYDLVSAHPAHDAFSLGVVLFQLCSDEPLFISNKFDNIDQEELNNLYDCSDAWKEKKLMKVGDILARNMIAQLLAKNPSKRPSMSHIMVHPFITGKVAVRMIGEEPEFDVFISYRVASDAHHAALLYERLTAVGLKVWWGKSVFLGLVYVV
jgi:serine/threonine protein kinase